MYGITLKNQVLNSVPIAISIGRKNIDISGTSLSTGLKTNNDVVSSFLGRNLNDRSKILNQFYKNVGYSSNIAQTAQEGLNSIARTLVEMQGIINSVGGSQTTIRSLNDIFQQKLLQIEQQTNSVKFDGVKLLTGEFGSNPIIKSKYNTKIVDVRKTGTGSGTLFEEEGAKAIKVIDVQNITNIKAGDAISLHDVNFKMVQNKELVTSESDILIGTSEEQTAENIATAIKNHSSESLRVYEVTARNKQAIITERSASTSHIPLIIRSPADGMIDNSHPSACGFKFTAGPTIGSKITISGVTFEFVSNGSTGSDPTKVEIKDGPINGAKALRDAIYNHPTTKDLINKKMLSIEGTIASLGIKSPLNQDVLGFTTAFNPGDIYGNAHSASAAITYAHKLTFTNPSVIGDRFRFVVPGVGNQDFNVIAALDINNMRRSLYNQILLNPVLGNAPAGLVNQGNLYIHSHSDNALIIYSDYDLNIQYIPAGVPVVTQSSAPISTADVFAIKPAVNVSNIRNIEGFIGKPKVSVKVMVQATSGTIAGDGLAAKLYSQVKGDVPLPTISVDGDIATVLHVDIAGRTFQSVVWQGNGTNLNNRELVFTENSTGESFSINTKDLNSDITTLKNTIDTLAKPIENLLSSTEFTQVRDLDIDNSSGEIIDDNGRAIGNVDGMTVSLNSTDFSNKQFEDFVIVPDSAVFGNTLFIATINDQEFVCKIRANELNEGKALTFSASNGDTLTINIGKGGINSLSDPKNYKFISSAIKKSLMKIGSGIDVRTGFDSDNVTKLVISDISATKLYRNNQNEYVPKLDLLTKESAKIAQEVITNALNLVYSARAKLQGQSEGLDKSVNFLNSTISVTKDASGGYLDTDLVEAASSFAAALKSILAAVSTLQAGAKVADAGLEIIKSAA
jgi:flagellin-like hook-associated protein FlgL